MREQKFDELISCFNRKVADMDIDMEYKMELLAMVCAFGYAHEKESAEPKITYCKDCKWWSKSPLTIDRHCSIFDVDTSMTFFCKHGRRIFT